MPGGEQQLWLVCGPGSVIIPACWECPEGSKWDVYTTHLYAVSIIIVGAVHGLRVVLSITTMLRVFHKEVKRTTDSIYDSLLLFSWHFI